MADASRAFIDTNVLLYAHDASETVKQPIARSVLERLWHEGTGVLSSQVLQEFYVVATKELRRPLPRDEAREIVQLYATWPVVVIDPMLVLAATRIEEDHDVSFWDAQIVEAARLSGAERLITEDLQDGQVVEGVRFENPFAGATTA